MCGTIKIESAVAILLLSFTFGASTSNNNNNNTTTTYTNSTTLKFNWPWVAFHKQQQQQQQQDYLLNEDYTLAEIDNFRDFERHPCRRVCQEGQSQRCYYQLVVHNYQRLGPECQRCQFDERACAEEHCIYGDGVATPLMAVNRMVPGPAIELCENDTVVVDVLNYLTESTTMHWHGMAMSRTPEMDGVPFVTQYPVQPGEVFRYDFVADRSGTLFYHSHVGWQRSLGVAGQLIVRQSRQENQHAKLYDYDLVEHAIMLQDIFYDYDFHQVSNILINGKGRNHLTQLPDNDNRHRYERLRVTSGYRYRFRVISNGIFSCPLEFSIEQHKLLIISTDGHDIEPVWADGFFLTSGERFDFVLEANQYAQNYWIRVRGFERCESQNLYQGAVLSYRGKSRTGFPKGPIIPHTSGDDNRRDATMNIINDVRSVRLLDFLHDNDEENEDNVDNKDTNVGTLALRSLYPVQWSRYTKFQSYYFSFGTTTAPNGERLFRYDDIVFNAPSVSLLQARHLYHDDQYFCNKSSLAAQGRDCVKEVCECVHVIRLPAYRPIELIIANYMESTHPFHIHGYLFRLVGQGVLGSLNDLRNIRELDRRGRLIRLSDDYVAVAKDVAQVPAMGYIIIRFLSDNPGFWLTHCHIEAHAIQGMAAVLKIGEDYQMKRIPARLDPLLHGVRIHGGAISGSVMRYEIEEEELYGKKSQMTSFGMWAIVCE